MISEKEKQNVINALLNLKDIDYLQVTDFIENCTTIHDFNTTLKKTLDVDYNSVDDLIIEADQALYKAKATGRNCVLNLQVNPFLKQNNFN